LIEKPFRPAGKAPFSFDHWTLDYHRTVISAREKMQLQAMPVNQLSFYRKSHAIQHMVAMCFQQYLNTPIRSPAHQLSERRLSPRMYMSFWILDQYYSTGRRSD